MATTVLAVVVGVLAVALLVVSLMARQFWKARERMRIRGREFANMIDGLAEKMSESVRGGQNMEKVEMDLWFCEKAMDLWTKAGDEAKKYVPE